MSSREADRVLILNQVQDKQINLVSASQLLGLSYPQTKRIWARYKAEGKKGLISQKRGKASNRAVSIQQKEEIVNIISKEYRSCKPLFISEKLTQVHQFP